MAVSIFKPTACPFQFFIRNLTGCHTGAGRFQKRPYVVNRIRIHISEQDIADLRGGFGISRIENRGGTVNVKSGFAGRNTKGVPNVAVARSIESGTSYRAKQSFVSTAGRQAKAAAEQAIAQTIDDEINKRMN